MTTQRCDDFKVLFRGEIQVKVCAFDESADAGEDFAAMRAERLLEEIHFAVGRCDEREQHANGRALPGTVRTEKAEDIAAADFEIHAADCPALFEALA